jgi:hypothetical protein
MFCYGLDLSADGVRYKEWSCRAGVTTIVWLFLREFVAHTLKFRFHFPAEKTAFVHWRTGEPVSFWKCVRTRFVYLTEHAQNQFSVDTPTNSKVFLNFLLFSTL